MITIRRGILGAGVHALTLTTEQVINPATGYILSIPILFNSNSTYLPSDVPYLKAALHEIGHTLGLQHGAGLNQTSVMNQFVDPVQTFGPNKVIIKRYSYSDAYNGLPTWVTKCDADLALASKNRLWP